MAEPMEETPAELPFTGDQVGLFRAQSGRPKRAEEGRPRKTVIFELMQPLIAVQRRIAVLLRGDLADRILAAAAHPDRWMRPLRGRRLYDNIVELPPEGV